MSEYKTWYEYTIMENISRSPIRKLKFIVPYDRDIIGVAIDYLRDEIFRERISLIGVDYWPSLSELKEILYQRTSENVREEIRWAADIYRLRCIVVPDYVVYSRYTIVGVKKTNGCEGCLIDALGQQNHMDCPDGCLHDRKMCVICAEVFNGDVSDDEILI